MAHSAGADWWRPQIVPSGAALPRAAPARIQDSAIPFMALMVFTFILLLSPQSFIPVLARAHIALLAGVFAVAAHCWTRFAAREPLMRVTREIGLAAALLGWAIVTIPFSMWPGGSVLMLIDLYLKALIIFWLLANTVFTLERLRTVFWGLSLMAVPLAATGVQNFLLHRDIGAESSLWTASSGAGTRIFGYNGALTQNPNDLALMLNLILPLTVGLLLNSRRSVVRGLVGGLIALDVSAIIVTFSRGGFLTLMTSFFLYLYTLRRSPWKRWMVAAVVLAVVAVPLLPSGYLDRVGTITNVQSDPTGSSQQRWNLTVAALSFMVNHPLIGAGLGMNILALNEILGQTWRAVHNVYLEYAVDLGWAGLGLFLALVLSCIRTAARVRYWCAKRPAMGELAVLADAIRISLAAFAVSALFAPVAYQFYFYYIAGLAAPLPIIYAAGTNE